MRASQSLILLVATATSAVAAAGEVNATSAQELAPLHESVVIAQLCGVDIVGHNANSSYKATNPDGCSFHATCSATTKATRSNFEGGTRWSFLTQKTGVISLVNGRLLTNGADVVVDNWANTDLSGNGIGDVYAIDPNA